MRGTEHPRSKLTDEQVLSIRRERAEGAKGHYLAYKYGIAETAVSKIVLRQTWDHIPPEAG